MDRYRSFWAEGKKAGFVPEVPMPRMYSEIKDEI